MKKMMILSFVSAFSVTTAQAILRASRNPGWQSNLVSQREFEHGITERAVPAEYEARRALLLPSSVKRPLRSSETDIKSKTTDLKKVMPQKSVSEYRRK